MTELRAIADLIFGAAADALAEGSILVRDRAKALAPVRNIFSDHSYHIRFKSMAEVEADRAAVPGYEPGRKGIFDPGQPHQPYWMTGERARPPRHWRQRRMLEAEFHLANYLDEMALRKAGRRMGRPPEPTVLSRRGAYEVKTKRARFAQWGQSYIGGRLRGEIFATPVSIAGPRAEAWVISPTPYARFQEFGTRHNAAHPFLRPGAEESREEVISRIAAAVAEVARTGSGIEIVVRI